MIPNEDATWPELLREPAKGDHFVQLYSDEAFLCEAVAEYAGTGLRRGEGVMLVATPAHRRVLQAHVCDCAAYEHVEALPVGHAARGEARERFVGVEQDELTALHGRAGREALRLELA